MQIELSGTGYVQVVGPDGSDGFCIMAATDEDPVAAGDALLLYREDTEVLVKFPLIPTDVFDPGLEFLVVNISDFEKLLSVLRKRLI